MQATGWGKSAVYWMATRALRDAGARSDAGGLPAARADARPGGGRGALGPAGRDPELVQLLRLARHRGRPARRPARRPAHQSRAAGQPRLRARRAARPAVPARHARHRRGALRVELGPRLPSRLPAPGRRARAAPRPPRARHHGDGQHAGQRRRRRAAGRADPRAARPARPRLAAPVGAAPARRGRGVRVGRRAPRPAARLGHRLRRHGEDGDRPGRVPRHARAPGAGLPRSDCSPTSGRRSRRSCAATR